MGADESSLSLAAGPGRTRPFRFSLPSAINLRSADDLLVLVRAVLQVSSVNSPSWLASVGGSKPGRVGGTTPPRRHLPTPLTSNLPRAQPSSQRQGTIHVWRRRLLISAFEASRNPGDGVKRGDAGEGLRARPRRCLRQDAVAGKQGKEGAQRREKREKHEGLDCRISVKRVFGIEVRLVIRR